MTTRRSHRDVYHGAMITLLHTYKAWTRSQETGKFSQTEPGSADIMVQLRHGACAIEVKTAPAGTFRFPDWRQNQREWATQYETELNNVYWLAIFFETETCPWKSLRKPRVPYLIPATEVLQTIQVVPQDSFPYLVGKGMPIEMQEHHYDASTLWNPFMLEWLEGQWSIPTYHPFYIKYIGDNLGQQTAR